MTDLPASGELPVHSELPLRSDLPLRSERLMLRSWRESDCEHFAALNADPEVTRHFPASLSRSQSDALADRIALHFLEHGFGLWVVERNTDAQFIGVVGLAHARFEVPFAPAVEVGWRIARAYWGHGYATEAARRALAFGFGKLALDEIVSYTVAANVASWRVMERIGMQRDQTGDFDHPSLPKGHALQRHILYRLRRADIPALI